MSSTSVPPKIPVKVAFRKAPPVGASALSGVLAKEVAEQFAKPQVMAILPYQPLPGGMKSEGMVAMVAEGGERLIVHYTTIVKNTVPAEAEDYKNLLHEMENLGGYEVEVIQCTNIDHDLRRAERVKAKKPDAESSAIDHEIVAEPIEIQFDIVNDDVESPGGFGTGNFSEDWA